MAHDRRRFFAVWTARTAYALDAYPDEIDRYRRELIRHRHVAGPFDTEDEAYTVATRNLIARQRLNRADR